MSLSNAHTIKKTFSLSPKLSGPPASNHTFEVCKEDSNLIPVGSSWVGGGDSAALNGPFDGVKHPPISESLILISTCPWGQPSAKRKAERRLLELGIALSRRGLSCLALLLASSFSGLFSTLTLGPSFAQRWLLPFQFADLKPSMWMAALGLLWIWSSGHPTAGHIVNR